MGVRAEWLGMVLTTHLLVLGAVVGMDMALRHPHAAWCLLPAHRQGLAHTDTPNTLHNMILMVVMGRRRDIVRPPRETPPAGRVGVVGGDLPLRSPGCERQGTQGGGGEGPRRWSVWPMLPPVLLRLEDGLE